MVRDEFLRLIQFVTAASGARDQEVRQWLSFGMLMNVAAAMDLGGVDADWARLCMGFEESESRSGRGRPATAARVSLF